MEKESKKHENFEIDRRAALSRILIGSIGLTLGFSGFGFRSMQIPTDPEDHHILSAFMEAIVPGLNTNHPNLTRVFYDPFYKFKKYRKSLISDLKKRTRRLFRLNDFPSLSIDQRARVIKEALNAGLIKRKIYIGAIYLTQITAYTGFYKDCTCPIIDFDASYNFEPTSYKDAGRFLGPSLTSDGNFV